MALIGRDGPAVVLDARTCAWLERFAGLSKLRVRVRGTDPHISEQLLDIRAAAMSWGSAVRTEVADSSEPAPRSDHLGTGEVAEVLGIGSRAVVKAIHEGRLPAQKVGPTWRLAREDVEHYRAATAARN